MRVVIHGLTIGLLGLSLVALAAKEVMYKAADGVTVYAEYAEAKSKARGLIVLFHQADGSHLEYEQIGPRLNAMGFATLAVDQRSGGSLFGGPNKTAAGIGKPASYLDALPDLEASVKYARSVLKSDRVIAWGSSYSSALVFLLAAKIGNDLAGVLSFSPDEYLGQPSLVRDAARKVKVPVFITSAGSEVAGAKQIFEAVASQQKVQFVPKGAGLHGSSVLANPLTRAEYWAAVEKFLERYK
jgi:alpha-beta hydrolase superfamily lysophospholipase